jgi:hypothetical protein
VIDALSASEIKRRSAARMRYATQSKEAEIDAWRADVMHGEQLPIGQRGEYKR